MNVLFISGELIGSALCHKLLSEGHEVKLYIEREGWKSCLDGIVPKTVDWRSELSWVGVDGLIIFDDVGYGAEQEALRKKGYSVVGGSLGGDRLETDREFFQQTLVGCGIDTLPSYNFTSATDAIRFVEDHPDRWVIKQNSHYGVLNYVGSRDDGKDVIGILHTYKNQYVFPLHLQKFVSGIEVGVARYFNGNDWVGPIEINHEYKRMCNDDIGPLTAEMGTVMWYSEDENLPLFTHTLAKLKNYLQKVNFRGDIDINCIVDSQHIWPLEATPRFGTPSTELQGELHSSPWGDFLIAIARGKSFPLEYKKEYGIVVSVAVPPYPYPPESIQSSLTTDTSVRLFFTNDINESDLEHIHFEEISKTSDEFNEDLYYWSGAHGYALHVTRSASTIPHAQKDVYRTLKKIILPKMFYRTDIGTRIHQHDLPKLKEWGWI